MTGLGTLALFLLAVLAGIGAGAIRGGKARSLLEAKVHAKLVGLVCLGLQAIVGALALRSVGIPRGVGALLLGLALVGLLGVARANGQLPGVPLLALGLLANLLVLVLNLGVPVSVETLDHAGVAVEQPVPHRPDAKHVIDGPGTRLGVLGGKRMPPTAPPRPERSRGRRGRTKRPAPLLSRRLPPAARWPARGSSPRGNGDGHPGSSGTAACLPWPSATPSSATREGCLPPQRYAGMPELRSWCSPCAQLPRCIPFSRPDEPGHLLPGQPGVDRLFARQRPVGACGGDGPVGRPAVSSTNRAIISSGPSACHSPVGPFQLGCYLLPVA